MRRSILLAILAPLLGAPAATAQERPLVTALPPAEEACYGRAYDAAHLSANPRQSIVEFYLARLHTPDPEREDEAATRRESIATAIANETQAPVPQTALQVMALLREPSRRRGGLVHCTSRDGVTMHCGAECDGGGFAARVDADEAVVRMRERGVRVGPGCGETGNEMLGARPADRVLRLARLPASACLDARSAARPDFVRHGPPLRTLLASRGTACFARTFDGDHLARTPDQQVASAVLTASWRPAADGAGEIDIGLRTRLRDGSSHASTARCQPTGYAFECESGGMERPFILTRGPEGSVLLHGPAADEASADGEPPLAAVLGLRLGRGDRTFRLDPAPVQVCPH